MMKRDQTGAEPGLEPCREAFEEWWQETAVAGTKLGVAWTAWEAAWNRRSAETEFNPDWLQTKKQYDRLLIKTVAEHQRIFKALLDDARRLQLDCEREMKGIDAELYKSARRQERRRTLLHIYRALTRILDKHYTPEAQKSRPGAGNETGEDR